MKNIWLYSRLTFPCCHSWTHRQSACRRQIESHLTQARLTEKLGIRQNMISDYERGKRRLSPEMAERIAEILDIKADRIS